MEQVKTNYGALSTLVTVFFFWGFIAAGNGIFIPFCKDYFGLDQFQSLLIDFAFYFAYYVGALLLFIIGTVKGRDAVGTWGYKNSIVYGLVFSAIGAGAMIISVYNDMFVGMLFGFFIVALGFSLQQTAANPFMISLGAEGTGSNRISLGGGINSLGTTIAPLVVGLILFGSAQVTDEMRQSLSLDKVIYLYAFVGALFLGIAALFAFSKKLPAGKLSQEIGVPSDLDRANKALASLLIITGLLIICFVPVFNSYRSTEALQMVELQNQVTAIGKQAPNQVKQLQAQIEVLRKPLDQNRMYWLSGGFLVVVGGLLFSYFNARKKPEGWGAMRYPQLVLGMLAIFIYVGVEVTIGSNLAELLKQMDYSASEIAPFIALFWGSLMIGRWASAIHVFDFTKRMKNILTTVIPLVAFVLALLFSHLAGHNVEELYLYVCCVLVLIVGFYLSRNKPVLTLLLFSVLGAVATLVGMFATGMLSIYGFMSAGLFCSIMWPCIFSLSLAGLGKYKTQGSALLVMMILGGAIIPLIQGKLIDMISIQSSFVVGVVCFVYLAFFAYFVGRMLKQQGVSLEA